MDFSTLSQYETDAENFSLTNCSQSTLQIITQDSNVHLLNPQGAAMVSRHIKEWGLLDEFPLNKKLFREHHQFFIHPSAREFTSYKIRKLSIPEDMKIMLYWDEKTALFAKWQYFLSHKWELLALNKDLLIFNEEDDYAFRMHGNEFVFYTNRIPKEEFSKTMSMILINQIGNYNYTKAYFDDDRVEILYPSPSGRHILALVIHNYWLSYELRDGDNNAPIENNCIFAFQEYNVENLSVLMSEVGKMIMDDEMILIFETEPHNEIIFEPDEEHKYQTYSSVQKAGKMVWSEM